MGLRLSAVVSRHRETDPDTVPPVILIIDRMPANVSLLREAFEESSCPVSLTHFNDPTLALLFLTETCRRRLRVADLILVDPGSIAQIPSELESIVSDAGIPIVVFSPDISSSGWDTAEDGCLTPISYVTKPRRLSEWESLAVQLVSLIAATKDG